MIDHELAQTEARQPEAILQFIHFMIAKEDPRLHINS